MTGSDADTRRHTVTGLRNNRTYKFKIRAVNAIGPGRESDEATGNPYPAVPGKPTGFQVMPGDKKAILSWNHPDDISIHGWEYRQKKPGGRYGHWTAIITSDENTTSHIVENLQNGEEYIFQIKAFNGSGNGYWSDEISVIPMPAVPGKPTGLSVEPGHRRALLTWRDPGNDTIDKWQYAYEAVTGNRDWTDMAGSGAETVRHVVAMLENDIVYKFRIRAVNSVGAGIGSDAVSATPMASAPGKPAGLVAFASDRQVVLSWTDPVDASILKWQYAYRTGSAFGNWIDIPDSAAATTRHTVSGLTNGAAYTFKIRAVNDVGAGPDSDEASATPLSVPAKPSGFTVTAGDARVALGWNDPRNSSITGWQYSYRTSGGYGSWTDIPGSSATTAGHIVTGLSNGAEHTFKIRAVNGSGLGAESDAVAATPRPVPGKPTGFRTEAGNTQVRLLWSDPNDSSITSWQYKFRTAGAYGTWTDIPGGSAATVRHTVTGLANDTAHAFRIRALNGSGAGPESEEKSATPKAAPPAKPTGFQVQAGDGELLLAWDDPDDASIQGWQYRSRKSDGQFGALWNNIPGSGAKTVRHTVTGLENGAVYTFKIRAVNAFTGYESEEVSATPRSLRPAAPAGLNARPGDAEVALAWDDPGDPTISGWQYAVRTTGAFSEWTDIPGSAASTTAHTVTGLENGVEYGFKLRAVNEHGGGVESGEVSATPVAIPAKPSGLTATPGDAEVALAWDNPNDPTVAGWQYKATAAGENGNWADVPGSGAETAGHIVTGLKNGVAYRFRVRARNASGVGPESDEAAATPVPVPAKPAGFAARAGDGKAVLQWDDPDDPTITGWEYSQRHADGDYEAGWITMSGSGAMTAQHAVTGLKNGVAYVFKIRAVNASGDGAESDEATATPVAVPGKPAGFAATPGDGQARLSWNDPNDPTIARWQYRMAAGGAYGDWTDIPGSGAATVEHDVTGLDNGTTYKFRIRAANGSGSGPESNEATAVPFALPGKPSGFTATPGNRQVVLEWDDPGDSGITGWQYNQRRGSGAFEEDWTYILGSAAATTSHTVIGLDAGVSYGFKIRAVTGEGIGKESDEATVTLPLLPAKPAGLAATPGDGMVLLEWTALGDSTVTLWQYSYRTDGAYSDWTDIPGSDAATKSHEVTGLDNGTTYKFRIRAVNGSGSGLESDEATATPFALPGKPSGFTATPGNGQVLLEWDDPGDPAVTGITGWQYNQRRGDGPYEEYWTYIIGTDGTTTSHTVIGLDAGVSYGFKIRAVTDNGIGKESDEATVTLPLLPAKPAGLAATPGDGMVLLEWAALDDPTVTLWQYNYRTDGAYGAWTDMPGSGAATVEHTVTSLDNGTTYKFRIRAVNGSGSGLESDEVTAVPFALPGKPSGFTATPGNRQVLLEWDDPGDPAVTGITGWQYNQRRGDGPYEEYWTYIIGTDGTTTSHTVIGLDAGVSYGFKIRAVTDKGIGKESDEATVTLPLLPAKPAGLTAMPGDGRALLEWTALDDPTVALWQYSYRTDGADGAWTDIPGSDAATTSHEVTGLENRTPHIFRIRAVNGNGSGLESDEVTVVPFALPGKPSGFTATPGDRQVLLEWDDPGDPAVTGITGWQYNQRRGSGAYEEDWTYIIGTDGTTTSHTVIGLETGVSYSFKIQAVADEGVGAESDEATATLAPVPAKPAGLTAVPGDGRALLEWTALDDPTVTLWQYSYRTDGAYSDWTDILGSDATTTSHEVTGLDNGTPHTFRIRAANNSGFGLGSEEITTVPIAVLARPEGLRATPGDGSALLEWNDPDDARIVRWQYVAGASGNAAPDEWTDMAGSGPGTTRHVVEGLENGTAHVFRVRFCISEDRIHPDCSPGSDPVFATPEAATAPPAARKAVKAVLATLAGRMAAGAEAVIGDRFSPDAVAPRFVLAGRDLPLFGTVGESRAQRPAARDERTTVVGISGQEARRKSAFQFSPGPPVADNSAQWSLWHRSGLEAFEGAAGPQAHYSGRLLSAWFGADMRWDRRWLAGAAFARRKAEVDYVADAESGVLKMTLDSAHPYLQRRFEEGGEAWMTLGGGRGRIENTAGGRGVETADVRMATVSVGYRSPLPEFGGLKFSAFGAGGFARLDTGGTAGTTVGALSAAADRQSVGIEASTGEGQTSRYASISLRRDGGDGVTGKGLELASGVRAPLPLVSGHIDLRLRWLAWHSERGYREFGLTADIRRPGDASRRGLSWSLDAALGPQDSGPGKSAPLWSDDPRERRGGTPAPAAHLQAGWNFVSRGAVFAPQAAIGLTGAKAQRLALGFDAGPLSGPTLTLAAERLTPPKGVPEHRISAAMQFRF